MGDADDVREEEGEGYEGRVVVMGGGRVHRRACAHAMTFPLAVAGAAFLVANNYISISTVAAPWNSQRFVWVILSLLGESLRGVGIRDILYFAISIPDIVSLYRVVCGVHLCLALWDATVVLY